MSTTSEITALNRAIGELRHCVGALRSRYGDAAAIQRLANDVDRLDIDAADLREAPTAPKPRTPAGHEIVEVPDTPYDPHLWQGADDEGIGGQRRAPRT